MIVDKHRRTDRSVRVEMLEKPTRSTVGFVAHTAAPRTVLADNRDWCGARFAEEQSRLSQSQ